MIWWLKFTGLVVALLAIGLVTLFLGTLVFIALAQYYEPVTTFVVLFVLFCGLPAAIAACVLELRDMLRAPVGG